MAATEFKGKGGVLGLGRPGGHPQLGLKARHDTKPEKGPKQVSQYLPVVTQNDPRGFWSWD